MFEVWIDLVRFEFCEVEYVDLVNDVLLVTIRFFFS